MGTHPIFESDFDCLTDVTMVEKEGTYSLLTAALLIFNTVVGMGIWTLPKLIYETGTVASFIILFISAIFSYIVASFINELQGNGNAIKKLGLTRDNESKSLDEDKHTLLNEDESRSLEDSSIYAVTDRIELSMAVKTILGERSAKVFYFFILCSLQIALSAYIVTIAKTSRNLLCRQMSCEADNFTESSDNHDDFIKCDQLELTERAVYILVMFVFSLAAVPIVSLDMANSTFIQYIGTILRWITILIVIMLPVVVRHNHQHEFSFSSTNWSSIPIMFGIANNSFGCHEALPSLLYPINKKRHSLTMLAITFGIILILFLALSSAALTSFDGAILSDVYLLNFQNDCDLVQSDWLRFFLTFYPIIPSTTNFFVFHVVCQRNVRVLLNRLGSGTSRGLGYWTSLMEKMSIISIVSAFPIMVGLGFDNVGEIFGVGGAIVTSVSSYLFPVLMLFKSRRLLSHVPMLNPVASSFGGDGPIMALIVFIIFVIFSNVYELL